MDGEGSSVVSTSAGKGGEGQGYKLSSMQMFQNQGDPGILHPSCIIRPGVQVQGRQVSLSLSPGGTVAGAARGHLLHELED